ncbi:MAG TPA: hypothetical protein VFL92_06905 [Sphingomonas sp.]|nr:hypothetical protein [Sphingomonas sp.]
MERARLICSVNRALWQEVGPNLRAVMAKSDGRTIRLRFFVDGEPSEDDIESASIAATEVISDFPDCEMDDQVIRLDAPARMPTNDEWLVIFMRRESV